ncbi:hypothetical protein [Bacillus sp. FJAT-45037]|uniref:hypothetical protein n=1 Tax=Bacillus sp. FJAT-45037 TaxID=2011007 RepID=UPI000C23145C|nr:hypothetical protein [Bacillus sp. FJAT-45037]
MSIQITKEHLDFMAQAVAEFTEFPLLETYFTDSSPYIALRRGVDRDCIEIHEKGEVIANFVQQIEPKPNPSNEVKTFSLEMEKKFENIFGRFDWRKEHHQLYTSRLLSNVKSLREELIKLSGIRDREYITKRCAYIAVLAMMIEAKEGKKE